MCYCSLKAPIFLHGEGSYAMSAVKDIRVTEEFLGLDEDSKECRSGETFKECTTREYLHTVNTNCKCVPYGLKHLSSKNQVKIIRSKSGKTEVLFNLNICIVNFRIFALSVGMHVLTKLRWTLASVSLHVKEYLLM